MEGAGEAHAEGARRDKAVRKEGRASAHTRDSFMHAGADTALGYLLHACVVYVKEYLQQSVAGYALLPTVRQTADLAWHDASSVKFTHSRRLARALKLISNRSFGRLR